MLNVRCPHHHTTSCKGQDVVRSCPEGDSPFCNALAGLAWSMLWPMLPSRQCSRLLQQHPARRCQRRLCAAFQNTHKAHVSVVMSYLHGCMSSRLHHLPCWLSMRACGLMPASLASARPARDARCAQLSGKGRFMLQSSRWLAWSVLWPTPARSPSGIQWPKILQHLSH